MGSHRHWRHFFSGKTRWPRAFMAIAIILGVVVFSPPPAFAQCKPGDDGFSLNNCLTLSDGSKVSDVFKTPGDMINLIVTNVMILAGVVFFLLIVYAGFQIVTGGSKGADQAKQMLTTGVIGLLLMFSAYWIVQIVQYVTGVQFAL